MSDYSIIDRRKNPRGKNLPNRQRFLKRARKYLREQIREKMSSRRIKSKDGEDIAVPGDGLSEPSFEYDRNTGEWERILPGNQDYIVGDTITKPKKGGGSGGTEGSNQSGGKDDFVFSITRSEYLDLVFEDLELPDMVKKSQKASTAFQRVRAGFQLNGNPSVLDLVRSLKNSLGRRLALKRPTDDEIEKLETLIATSEGDEKQNYINELDALLRKRKIVPWVDPIDIRYRRWEKQPIPTAQAVIFCLMDVSGSMDQRKKDISKRFYLLLYLFLQRNYKKVDIVFIRHTEEAKECDEEEFFNSQESGGTVISTGLELVNDVINRRYPLDAWNIYVVQASDGDNYSADNLAVMSLMNVILPKVQYYVYAEVKYTTQDEFSYSGTYDTHVWAIMDKLSRSFERLCRIRLSNIEDVVPVFRRVFSKEIKK